MTFDMIVGASKLCELCIPFLDKGEITAMKEQIGFMEGELDEVSDKQEEGLIQQMEGFMDEEGIKYSKE